MTPTLWALSGLALVSALLCVWAWFTGRPDPAPVPRHAAWGDGRTVPLRNPWELGDTGSHVQAIRVPTQRWYDENPWPHDGPHGWAAPHD